MNFLKIHRNNIPKLSTDSSMSLQRKKIKTWLIGKKKRKKHIHFYVENRKTFFNNIYFSGIRKNSKHAIMEFHLFNKNSKWFCFLRKLVNNYMQHVFDFVIVSEIYLF